MAVLLDILPYLLGLGVLLLLSAFFSGSETALFSLSRTDVQRLRNSGQRSGQAVADLRSQPRRLLITILVGNMFVNVASASLIAGLAVELLGNKGVGVAIAVTTFLLLIFGEVTPKTLAVRTAETFARLVARPLRAFSMLILPIRFVLRSFTNVILFVLRQGKIQSESLLTKGEFQAMLQVGKAQGVIHEHERQIVEHIFGLREIVARDVMVPRTDIICLDDGVALDDALEVARRTKHSRIPVHDGDLDRVWGALHVKDSPAWRGHDVGRMSIRDFVAHRDRMEDPPRFPLVRPAYFVPELCQIEPLLYEMGRRGTHLAILLDEYGGTSGLVTLADLLEELVGEMLEEHDRPDADYLVKGDTVHLLGRAKIRDLNRDLGLDIPEGKTDTIGGYVMDLVGEIPKEGQTVMDGSLQLTVIRMSRQRVNAVELQRVTETLLDQDRGTRT